AESCRHLSRAISSGAFVPGNSDFTDLGVTHSVDYRIVGVTMRKAFPEMRSSLWIYFGRNAERARAKRCGSQAIDRLPEASMFTAIQEQPGLRLEAALGPVQYLTIQRVNEPSAN